MLMLFSTPSPHRARPNRPVQIVAAGLVAVSLLPDRLAWQFARLEPFGFPILLVLLFTGILGEILWPLIVGFRYLLSTVFGF